MCCCPSALSFLLCVSQFGIIQVHVFYSVLFCSDADVKVLCCHSTRPRRHPPTIPLSHSPPSLPPCCNASRNPASSPISRSEIKSKHQGDSQSRPMMTRPMLIKISPGLRKRTKLLVPDYRCVDSDNNLALALLSSTTTLSILRAVGQVHVFLGKTTRPKLLLSFAFNFRSSYFYSVQCSHIRSDLELLTL